MIKITMADGSEHTGLWYSATETTLVIRLQEDITVREAAEVFGRHGGRIEVAGDITETLTGYTHLRTVNEQDSGVIVIMSKEGTT